tara:strand:+ start:707 stop:1282 length:576 start_codon:yes stop_codon:yes gene_type:complete
MVCFLVCIGFVMENKTKVIKEAAKHFRLNRSGSLSKVSTPLDDSKGRREILGTGAVLTSAGPYAYVTYKASHKSKRVRILAGVMVYYLYNGTIPKRMRYLDGNPRNLHPQNLADWSHQKNEVSKNGAQPHVFLEGLKLRELFELLFGPLPEAPQGHFWKISTTGYEEGWVNVQPWKIVSKKGYVVTLAKIP